MFQALPALCKVINNGTKDIISTLAMKRGTGPDAWDVKLIISGLI